MEDEERKCSRRLIDGEHGERGYGLEPCGQWDLSAGYGQLG